jgi:hypothetical protein
MSFFFQKKKLNSRRNKPLTAHMHSNFSDTGQDGSFFSRFPIISDTYMCTLQCLAVSGRYATVTLMCCEPCQTVGTSNSVLRISFYKLNHMYQS